MESGKAEGQQVPPSVLKQHARDRAVMFLNYLLHPIEGGTEGVFDKGALEGLENIQSDGPGHVVCELPVVHRNANIMGNLHGGCTGVPPPC